MQILYYGARMSPGRFMSSGRLLDPALFKVQSKFLADVAADAQVSHVVQVVTSPRGFRKSACARNISCENPIMRTHFGTANIPIVKIARFDHQAAESGYVLADELLEEVSEDADTKEVALKGRRALKLLQMFKKYAPVFLPKAWHSVKTAGRTTLMLYDDVLGGRLKTGTEVDNFFRRVKQRLDKDPKLAVILFK